jgi:hypothetical protein
MGLLIFISKARTVLFCTKGVAIRFSTSYLPGTTTSTYAMPVDKPDATAHVWDYAGYEEDVMLRFASRQGTVSVENPWNGIESPKVAFTFGPGADGVSDGSIDEFGGGGYHAEGPGPYTLPVYMEKTKLEKFPYVAPPPPPQDETFDAGLVGSPTSHSRYSLRRRETGSSPFDEDGGRPASHRHPQTVVLRLLPKRLRISVN